MSKSKKVEEPKAEAKARAAKAPKAPKQYILVKWDSNWADEMDVEGFAMLEKSEADKLKKTLKNFKREFTVCIGTNEEIDYEKGSDMLDELEFKKISEEEYKTVKKLFGTSGGHDFVDIVSELETMDQDDEEDQDSEN